MLPSVLRGSIDWDLDPQAVLWHRIPEKAATHHKGDHHCYEVLPLLELELEVRIMNVLTATSVKRELVGVSVSIKLKID